MADNPAGGGNRLLYSIIGVLGGIIVVGGAVVFGGNLLNFDKTTPVDPALTTERPAPGPVPAAAPVQPSAIPQPPAPPDAELQALAASIDRAIAAGVFTHAERLLADANRKFAGNGAWPPLQQKLVRARAARDAQIRQTEARRLIAEARQFAQVGDFSDAEALLQEAEKQAPGFAETGQARSDISVMRTERGQLYRERYQYQAAIDQALTARRLWEADRLLADYSRRFSVDDEYRARANRLVDLRAESTWQARLNQSRNMIGNARQAMDRGDFVEAERLLVLADQSAPGFPEINQARADLSRRRVAAEQQQDGIRLILAAIDTAFQRRQYDDAEHAIEDGRRRYDSYPGWADLQRRTASARQGNEQEANELRLQNARALELVTVARRNTAQGDFAAAERALAEANSVSTSMPEVAIARAEFERAKADRARQDAEIRAVAASVDAALARQQYADAERLIASGAKSYPSHPSWVELSRRLAEGHRTTPGQTGNAPMPAPPAPIQVLPAAPSPPASVPAPPVAPATTAAPAPASPQATTLPAAPARTMPPASSSAAAPTATPPLAAPSAAPPAVTVPRANTQVPQLLAAARQAIKRSDFPAAEKAVADAEKLDAKAAAEVRAELKAALDKTAAPPPLATPLAPPVANPPPAAPALTTPADNRAAAATSAPAAQNPRVLQLVASARSAMKRSNLAKAEQAVAEAEKIDSKATAVLEVRAELNAAVVANLVEEARDAIKRSDFTTAEKAVAAAEKLDVKAASEVRVELNAAQGKSKDKRTPASRN